MKKIALIFFTLMFCLNVQLANAADKVAFVILKEPYFRTLEYDKAVQRVFTTKFPVRVQSGQVVQTNYMRYWLNQGLLTEGEPTVEHLIKFVGTTDYDKIIFVMPVTSPSYISNGLSLNAFLVDREKIIISCITSTEYNRNPEAFEKLLLQVSGALSSKVK